MNRFLPQLFSLHFYWYVQKLLMFVILHPVVVLKVFVNFDFSGGIFISSWSFLHLYVCMMCVHMCIHAHVYERVCVFIQRAQVGVGGLPQLLSTLLYTEACPPGFTWVLGLLHVGAGDLASGPRAFCNKHFNQSHLSSPTLGSVICSIILSVSRNNEHLKISFMF